MLILFNKDISVACSAMRCWQCFLLLHFSRDIDADVNIAASSSLKTWRKNIFVLAMQWQLILFPGCKNLDVSPVLLLSPINPPVLRSCYQGHLTLLCGRDTSLWGWCRCVLMSHLHPLLAVRGDCWHPSLESQPMLWQACHLFYLVVFMWWQQTAF